MDKLKEQFAVVAKYGFWIGSGIVLLASLAVWYMTTSTLQDERDKQAGAISNAVNTVRTTQSDLPKIPNDTSHAVMEAMIEERKDEVLQSWTTLFERQQSILKWPTDVFTDELLSEFEGKLPIESEILFPTEEKDELETTLRDQYAKYIKNVLPEIAEAGGTEWTAPFERSAMAMGEGGMGGMGGMTMGRPPFGGARVGITGAEQGPLVKWSSESQQSLLKDLFPWRPELPSTLEIYYSQENLWILRQLMEIVSDVNGEATQPFQAKIREITRIGIGNSVKFTSGTISAPGATGGPMMGGMGDMGDMADMGDMMGQMQDMGGMGDMGGGGGMVAEKKDPAENRYVNASLDPVTGAALRSALSSNSPSDAALAVAKRVPVKMSLTMDQRAVPELVAACGSAQLMVEVHQVRILPKDMASGGGGGMGGMGGMEEQMEDMGVGGMGGGTGMGAMGGMGGMGAGAGANKKVDEFPLDMLVEVYGIIYIYNPPDGEKLGIEQVTEDTVVDGVNETMGGKPVETTDTDTGELPTPTGDPNAVDPNAAEPNTVEPNAVDPNAAAPNTAAPTPPVAPGGNGGNPNPPTPANPGGANPGGASTPPAGPAPAGTTPPAGGSVPAGTTTAPNAATP